jgi:HAMP domain-containing protein
MFSHYSLVRERQTGEWRDKMRDSLDQISKYNSDDRFFHGMLQADFRKADRAASPLEACRHRLGYYRATYPGMFRFVIYDAAGRILEDMSDEKRFQYVLKGMYQVISSVNDHVARVIIPYPDRLDEVRSRISLIRGYFGQFLMEKHLSLPLLEGYLGSCIRASEDPEKSLLWYQSFKNFTMVAFIHRDLTGLDIGPRLIIDRYNRSGEACRMGLFDTQQMTVYGIDTHQEEMVMQANTYANSAVEFVNSERSLIFFRQISPRLIVFSLLDKHENLVSPDRATAEFMLRMIRWLILVAFLVWCMSLRYADFALSVRQKLLLLFLFANGLPMLILAATAYEFFDQKKNSLINATHDQSVRIIKQFDNGYPDGREKMASLITDFVREKNRQYGSAKWPDEEVERLKTYVLTFNPGETYVYDRDGNQIMQAGAEALANSVKVIRDFFKGCLEFFNHADENFVAARRTMLEKITDDAGLYAGVLEHLGNISPQNFGSGMRWTYLEMLGDRSRHDSWGFLVITWRPGDLQRAFFHQHLEEINRKISPRQLLVMEKGTESIFPPGSEHERQVRSIMHSTQSRKLITENNFSLAGKQFVATSLVGIELSDAIIMALYPSSIILAEIDELRRNFILAGLLSILIVLVIVRFFSGRLLLPVNALSKGMRSIARRDFEFRIDYSSGDEFGELTSTFNNTIAGMHELAVGTAVQESLLPPGREKFGRISLFARSIFMSKMGGDYYDYFKVDDQRFGVYFGDVAGHGIPAALVMAMAKAVVASSDEARQAGPAELLKSANSLFIHLKEKGWKRMMTALCLEVNHQTGEFRVANAGQCYPVVVSATCDRVNYIKAVGMPLGSIARRPYVEVSGQLMPGDSLILYTDGIIEASNSRGEVFDFSRFEQLLLASWHADLETWWEGIYRGYLGWAATQDDDITFLMLKYEND